MLYCPFITKKSYLSDNIYVEKKMNIELISYCFENEYSLIIAIINVIEVFISLVVV